MNRIHSATSSQRVYCTVYSLTHSLVVAVSVTAYLPTVSLIQSIQSIDRAADRLRLQIADGDGDVVDGSSGNRS